MKKYLSVIAAALTLCACNKNSARLTGQFMDCASQPVYLEIVNPGYTSIVDSTVTDKKGEFRFKIHLKDHSTTIFNLKSGGELIPLIISPKEKVRVTSVGKLSQNYKVTGSHESQLVSDLNNMLNDGTTQLAEISKEYMSQNDEAGRKAVTSEYLKKYYSIKRSHIGFIVCNASAMAGLYALYQRLPGDDFLYNGANDIVYYRMVADSIARTYPDSKYLVTLQKDIKDYDATQKLHNDITDKTSSPVGFPPLTLPDMYGQKIDLASIVAKNQYTLVCFWSAEIETSPVMNAELRKIYESYHDKGFEIYQISIDTSKPLWVTSVQDQKLPWISVCDFKGATSPAIALYNVNTIPYTYLISNKGEMVGTNLLGNELSTKLNELLK